MLFCYPAAAADENWLHDGLMNLLTRMFDGRPEPLDDWLAVFPTEKRDEIERKSSLLAALERVAALVIDLAAADRAIFRAAMESQNSIPAIFDPTVAVIDCPEGHGELIEQIESLFRTAFKLLSSLGIRDRQYAIVEDSLPAHICPFCGIEPMTASDPIIPREDLDHYLSIARYPFAGVNLRNLAPTGAKCNGSHKLGKDMLRDDALARRRCFDPYGTAIAGVSLSNSQPLEGEIVKAFKLPLWQIDLIGDPGEVATWDAVYDIRARYRLNVLNKDLRHWLDKFANWVAYEAVLPNDGPQMVALLERYSRVVIQGGPKEFLERETFAMLIERCQNGPSTERVIEWLRSLLAPSTGAAIFPEAA